MSASPRARTAIPRQVGAWLKTACGAVPGDYSLSAEGQPAHEWKGKSTIHVWSEVARSAPGMITTGAGKLSLHNFCAQATTEDSSRYSATSAW